MHRANRVASYKLLFVEGGLEPLRKLNIEAADDDAAIACASEQSVRSGMAVEVWNSEFVIRATPLTAVFFTED